MRSLACVCVWGGGGEGALRRDVGYGYGSQCDVYDDVM